MENYRHNNDHDKTEPGRDPRLVALGSVIKEARETRCVTQEEMAERMGTGQNEVSRIENGALDYSISKLMEVSEALGGAMIEIEVNPLDNNGEGKRFEYSYVLLQDFAGYNETTSSVSSVATIMEDGEVIEEKTGQVKTVIEDEVLLEQALKEREARKTL